MEGRSGRYMVFLGDVSDVHDVVGSHRHRMLGDDVVVDEATMTTDKVNVKYGTTNHREVAIFSRHMQFRITPTK